jgi:hypothetical protein
MAERPGYPIRSLPVMARAFPLMLLSITISSGYISLRYFMQGALHDVHGCT